MEVDDERKLRTFYGKRMATETKAPKIRCLVTPSVLQHKCQCVALQKQHPKTKKEEATERLKRMKEAKEKICLESSLRASTSKSDSSQK
ncbi:40S ribosomal protein S6 [Myotis brandtii]|uniref:40S ribosomal protein S6 n=1 Tax=Myotis brandtii TaxID=109478 RepID=S7Q1A8_MYOBR|nr:40S ribosomal protein S6 [Myotis brandtii]